MHSQQPAYFILGDDQFRGVQIYDVLQDKDLNYWFATNEGLYYYDYLTYKKIEIEDSKTNSVFALRMADDGIIYCHNLNNQIFQIKDKVCSLFYELHSEETNLDISLLILPNGNLLVGAKQMIILNKTGNVIKRYNLNGVYTGPGYTTADKRSFFHLIGTDSLLIIINGVFTKQALLVDGKRMEALPHTLIFFQFKKEIFAYDIGAKNLFKFDERTFNLHALVGNVFFENELSIRLYESGNELWVGRTLPGINLITDEIMQNNPTMYYKDYFISDVFKDKEGNFLLSTFDNGVLVVPDLKVPDVAHRFREDPITTLYSDSKKGLYLGSSKGKLVQLSEDGTLKNLNTNGKKPIITITGKATSEWVIYDDGYIKAYNKLNGNTVNITQSSLKDAVSISANTFYLGTNNGILKWSANRNKEYTLSSLDNFQQRIYSLEYNSIDKLLYTSTAKGMFVIDSLGKSLAIKYKGKEIFPNYIHYHEGKIFISDKKNGILTLKNDKIVSTVQPRVNNAEEVLTKFIIHKKNIIGKSVNGLFEFDSTGKLLKSIHTFSGISARRIIDFDIHENNLWVSHTEGVQKIDLNYQQSKSPFLNVRIDKLNVNDEEKSLQQASDFRSDQRKIQFTLSVPTLRNRETIHYHYKLESYDTGWNVNNSQANKITYNALAPGSYTFLVKAENGGEYSETVSYKFSIAQPFYLRWWFISGTLLTFLLIVYIIYRWQINVQHKKSQQINEVNASKLTAIQSQMNPHFIFNALNSIQDLVLKGDVENSYSYITTFSNLVRRTLNYSEKEFIDFEQELKLLELYLSLEQLRFKKDFSFEIVSMNVDDIMVPPLLVQPFIENSLVHGLLHKEGEKKLKITFELGETLTCIIEDNGIGREKSKIIKQRQRSNHESFSGKAIRNRFEILSTVFKGEYGYIYKDLYRNNEPVGTMVTLNIPIQHKF